MVDDSWAKALLQARAASRAAAGGDTPEQPPPPQEVSVLELVIKEIQRRKAAAATKDVDLTISAPTNAAPAAEATAAPMVAATATPAPAAPTAAQKATIAAAEAKSTEREAADAVAARVTELEAQAAAAQGAVAQAAEQAATAARAAKVAEEARQAAVAKAKTIAALLAVQEHPPKRRRRWATVVFQDAARKQTREDHEESIAQVRTTLEGKVAEFEQELATAEEALKKADELGKQVVGTRIKASKTTEITPMVEEIKAKLEKAKETLDEVHNETSTIAENVHPELQDWINIESKKLAARATGMLPRLEIQRALLKRANAELKKQDASEVKALESQVVGVLKNHQKAKKLTAGEMFDVLSKKKQTVGKASFLAFFKGVDVSEPFAATDLERVFKRLAEGQTTVSKESFMKVLEKGQSPGKIPIETYGSVGPDPDTHTPQVSKNKGKWYYEIRGRSSSKSWRWRLGTPDKC